MAHVIVYVDPGLGPQQAVDLAWAQVYPWATRTLRWMAQPDGTIEMPADVYQFCTQTRVHVEYIPHQPGPTWLGAADVPAHIGAPDPAAPNDWCVWVVWVRAGEVWTWDPLPGSSSGSGSGSSPGSGTDTWVDTEDTFWVWYRAPLDGSEDPTWTVVPRGRRWPPGQPLGIDAWAAARGRSPWWGALLNGVTGPRQPVPWNRRVLTTAPRTPPGPQVGPRSWAETWGRALAQAGNKAPQYWCMWPRPLWGQLPGPLGHALVADPDMAHRADAWAEDAAAEQGALWRVLTLWTRWRADVCHDVAGAAAVTLWAQGRFEEVSDAATDPDRAPDPETPLWVQDTHDGARAAFWRTALQVRAKWYDTHVPGPGHPPGPSGLRPAQAWALEQPGPEVAPWTWRFRWQGMPAHPRPTWSAIVLVGTPYVGSFMASWQQVWAEWQTRLPSGEPWWRLWWGVRQAADKVPRPGPGTGHTADLPRLGVLYDVPAWAPWDDRTLYVWCTASVHETRPRHYIHYQLEQQESPHWTPRYLARLRGAHEVWDYAAEHLRTVYPRLGLSRPVHYLPPLVPTEGMWGSSGSHVLDPDAAGGRPCHVLFYGSVNRRRQRWLRLVQARLRPAGLVVRVETQCFGAELQARLRQAQVVLNLHYYRARTLEVLRLTEIIQGGCVAVSEAGADPALDREWSDRVVWTTAAAAADTLLAWCGPAAAPRRAAWVAQAQARLQDTHGGATWPGWRR